MRSILLCVLVWGCGGSHLVVPPKNPANKVASTPTPASMYEPTQGEDGSTYIEFHLPRPSAPSFYDLPWPSDLLKTAAGNLDLSQFPLATQLLVSSYVQAAEAGTGYSTSPTIYFHFSAAMPSSFPAMPADTMSTEANVFLVDVDANSPERGELVPLQFRAYASDVRYVKGNTVAAMALPGWALRPGTQYAAVVRRELGDATGALLGTTFDLEITKWTEARLDASEEAARQLHQPTYDYLESIGVARSDVAAIALFTTQVPAEVLEKMFDVATTLSGEDAPHVLSASWYDTFPYAFKDQPYDVIVGHYCTPNFQTQIDLAPFGTGGGTIAFDSNGTPLVSDIPEASEYYHAECGPLLEARFILTVPKSAMPASGFPLMESAHGTGGDATDMAANGANDFAAWAADSGIAGISTEQPLHYPLDVAGDPGARPGWNGPVVLQLGSTQISVPPGLNFNAQELFYNPVNPGAGRDNARQSTIDAVVLARLAAATDWSTLLDASRPIPRFDVTQLVASGHSQGSQTNAPYAAIEPNVHGVLLSGCGGDIRIGILERTNPFALGPLIAGIVETYPGELDAFHPLMALAQTVADPVDPQNFARLYRDPLPGRAPQNAMHFIGLQDTENPPDAGMAMAIALRAVQVGDVLSPVLGLNLAGIAPASVAYANNGGATNGFAEFNSTHGEDGHFVMYYEAGAQALAAQFFATVLPGPVTIGR